MNFIIPLLLATSIIFAAEFKVEKSKEFFIEATPTIMETTFSVSKDSASYESIQKTFNEIIEDIKDENICKGGQYNIAPRYSWNENKKLFSGYEGRVSFVCKFKESKKFDKILKKLDTKSVELSLSAIQWKIDEKDQIALERKVEKEALHYVKNEALFLSNELDALCEIEYISFNNSTQFNPQPMALRAEGVMMSENITTSPIKENLKISKNVAYKFECNSK